MIGIWIPFARCHYVSNVDSSSNSPVYAYRDVLLEYCESQGTSLIPAYLRADSEVARWFCKLHSSGTMEVETSGFAHLLCQRSTDLSGKRGLTTAFVAVGQHNVVLVMRSR